MGKGEGLNESDSVFFHSEEVQVGLRSRQLFAHYFLRRLLFFLQDCRPISTLFVRSSGTTMLTVCLFAKLGQGQLTFRNHCRPIGL